MDDKTNSNVTSKLSDKEKISTENCVILIKYETGKNIKTWVINEFVFVCGETKKNNVTRGKSVINLCKVNCKILKLGKE